MLETNKNGSLKSIGIGDCFLKTDIINGKEIERLYSITDFRCSIASDIAPDLYSFTLTVKIFNCKTKRTEIIDFPVLQFIEYVYNDFFKE